jgi:CRISPR/Cas system-associated protein Cas5 (RAMP superfamily)
MNQTEKEFKEKLDALLREYSVDISVEEEQKGYSSYIKGINSWAYKYSYLNKRHKRNERED